METHKALGTDNPETYFEVMEECGALNQICPLSNLDSSFLSKVSKVEIEASIRWACVVAPSSAIKEMNNSFNAPKEYKEISVVCSQIIDFKKLESINAEDIIELAEKTDLYRKEERFLKAEEASIFCINNNFKDELNWKELAKRINDIKASSDLKEGNLIAKKLRKDRLEAVQLYLSKT